MAKTALLILSEGSEEMEVVIPVDILRQAGVEVIVAGLEGANPTKCCRDMVIVPDMSIKDAAKRTFEVVILPGGEQGSENLAKSDIVKEILQTQEKNGRLIAAICAGPIALKSHSIGFGKAITAHPSKKADLNTGEYKYLEDRVVVSENIITSQGPGTAFEFVLAIVECLLGKEKATSLMDPMLILAPASGSKC